MINLFSALCKVCTKLLAMPVIDLVVRLKHHLRKFAYIQPCILDLIPAFHLKSPKKSMMGMHEVSLCI